MFRAGNGAGQNSSRSEAKDQRGAEIQRALDRAQRILKYRPRSEGEITTRLRCQGFANEVIEMTLENLRSAGLVDDASFATFWKENRQSFRPRSKRLLAKELQQKGIDAELIAGVTEEISDEHEAYRAGQKKSRSLSGADYYGFRRKLGAFLNRRGFDYEVINSVVEKVWKENTYGGEDA